MARPKSFDPDTALEQAMGVFWEKGYEAASVADLTGRMGINRFSLYDTFGDKRALYLAALDRYIERATGAALDALRSPDATLEDLEAWLVGALEQCDDERRCMVLRGAVEAGPGDAEVAERVEEAKSRVRNYFESIISREQGRGRVRAGVDPALASWGLYALHVGLSALGASGVAASRAVVAEQIAALRGGDF